jgi:hypothetical protein
VVGREEGGVTLQLKAKVPIHSEVQGERFYDGIDPGIRFAVRLLHAHGIPTCQSCEGGEGHAYDVPSVDLNEPRAFEAMSVLECAGIAVRDVSSIWAVVDGVPDERIWRIRLRDSLHDRASDRPTFITGHLHRDCWETA